MDSSDDSIDERIQTTKVLLGYASEEVLDDAISSLGGSPSWLGGVAPPLELLQCLVCRRTMNQLVQLDGELPEHFPEHARRLHVLICRARACSKKDGSIRAIRSTKIVSARKRAPAPRVSTSKPNFFSIGDDLFNHGKASPLVAAEESLSEVQSPSQQPSAMKVEPATDKETPQNNSFGSLGTLQNPLPDATHSNKSKSADFPLYYLDAEYEMLDIDSAIHASAAPSMANIQLDESEDVSRTETSSSFESSIDRAFQRFADRLAQNPLQVLRYEYRGFPLLYSKGDKIGRLISAARANSFNSDQGVRLPRCPNCQMPRVFELQVTPHAIIRLEGEGEVVGGMDWGTIILGVCEGNCEQQGLKTGEVSHSEEWVGVQWE